MKLLPIIIIAIFTEALGGAMLSRGMKQVGEIVEHLDLSQLQGITRTVTDALLTISPILAHYGAIVMVTVTNPSFITGLLLQIVFFLLFLTLLSRADLSYVLPVTSFTYVITAALAYGLLKEEISLNRWFGTLLICSGVLLVSRGESKTTGEGNAAVEETRE